MRIARVSLSLIVIAFLLVVTFPAAPAFALVGSITGTSSTSGPPGTLVTITGNGYTPGSTFTVHFGANNIKTGIVDAGGTLGTSTFFTVPAVSRDAYAITVTTSAGDTSAAPVTYTVTPTITLDVATGSPGDTIRVIGLGFAANSPVSILFDGGGATAGNSDSTGSFTSVAWTVPHTTPGRHTVTGRDTIAFSPDVAFVVVPKISLSAAAQSVGAQLVVSGIGFTTNSPVTFQIDGAAVNSTPVVTNNNGSFSGAAIVIPALSQGTHSVRALDVNANSATANIIISAALKINPQSGSPGTTVQVTGSGFAANSAITVTYNAADIATSPTPVSADASGSLSFSFVAPAGTSGSYAVQVSDGTNVAGSSFTISAGVSLDTRAGTVGTSFTLKGNNFNSGATVTITYDGAQIGTATADSGGVFSATLKAPGSQAGSHQVVASDGVNRVTSTFTISPSASLTPTSGLVGSSVTVSGSGFAASRPIVIRYNNIQVGAGSADGTGAFSVTIRPPASPSVTHQVIATDGVNTAQLSFTVRASAAVSPAGGNVGSNVTVTGSGFSGGGNVVVSYDNVQVATATADAAGSFTATFRSPLSKGGNHQVAASDGVNSVSGTFAISPVFSINPTSGNVGSNIVLTGLGFAAGAPVTIKYDNAQAGGTVNTDASGTFAATFIAPASKGGSHQFTVTDGTSTQTAAFAMDSVAPPAALLQSPEDKAKADALTVLGWSAVSDPSGVTYTLQIAADAAFSTIILEKKGLAATGYTLTEEERLKSVSEQAPYYWRVKVTDGASNEGPWSAPRTFWVGFVLSTKGLIGIGAVVAVLLGLLGFFLGRKSTFQW